MVEERHSPSQPYDDCEQEGVWCLECEGWCNGTAGVDNSFQSLVVHVRRVQQQVHPSVGGISSGVSRSDVRNNRGVQCVRSLNLQGSKGVDH